MEWKQLEYHWLHDESAIRRRARYRGTDALQNPAVQQWLREHRWTLTPSNFVRAMAVFCERKPWGGLAFPLLNILGCSVWVFHEFSSWSGFEENRNCPERSLSDDEFDRLLSPWLGPKVSPSNDEIADQLDAERFSVEPCELVRRLAIATQLPLRPFHVRLAVLWVDPGIPRNVSFRAERWHAVQPWWRLNTIDDHEFNTLLDPWFKRERPVKRTTYRG